MLFRRAYRCCRAFSMQGSILGGSSQDGRKWLINLVSKPPNWDCSPSKWPYKWLINGGPDPNDPYIRPGSRSSKYPLFQLFGIPTLWRSVPTLWGRHFLKSPPKICKATVRSDHSILFNRLKVNSKNGLPPLQSSCNTRPPRKKKKTHTRTR